MRLWRWSVLLLLGAATAAFGGRLSFQERAAVQESLSRVHPRMRASWLRQHGIEDPYYTAMRSSDSGQGLREVGRWSYGPSYDVDGRTTPSETLVALARGSGVSLLRFSRQDSLSIQLLSDINAEGLTGHVKVVDTLLYLSSGRGLEIYDISDEQNPVRLSWTPIPLNDFALQDSLVYAIGDSFRIYNVSNPAAPVFRGACLDSGDVVSVAGHTAFLGGRWGLYVLDVTNPSSPHRIGSWGSAVEQVLARGHLCYATTFNPNVPGEITFHILDVANPSLPYQIGSLDSVGGYGVYLVDTLAYCSGDADLIRFSIVSVADSTRPRALSTIDEGGWGMGMWASGLAQAAFGAFHWGGLYVFDTRNTSNPVRDTFLLDADAAIDISIDNGRAYVADLMSGLKILDVHDPTRPSTLGSYDTAGQPPSMASAIARDSFAFVDWFWFRVVDVSDPTHATAAGQLGLFNPPEDMVLRDSFACVAEAHRFQIVNVARPRQPVLVGSCVTGDATFASLCVQETLAFVGNYVGDVVNVRSPTSPQVVGHFGLGCNISVRDTFAFLATGDPTLLVYSVADPTQPRLIDSVDVGTNSLYCVEPVGSLLYAGNDDGVRVVDASDVHNMRVRGYATAPDAAGRLSYASPYLYAACGEAGTCIFESTQVGVAEPKQLAGEQARKGASVVRRVLNLEVGSRQHTAYRAELLDVSGRKVMNLHSGANDVRALAPGVYFVREAQVQAQAQAIRKVIKLK
ncbi:MAG TPA: hypothetical protein VMH22_07630 [bacterium]|nr:hypothetical protein [bacterium]